MIRQLGLLENTQSFCSSDCTFTQCHTIIEVGKDTNSSLNDLAARLKVDKSAMSRTVDELVKKGLVFREQDPNDRRYIRISLTSLGLQKFEDIDAKSRSIFEQLLQTMPAEEHDVVIKGLQLFSEALTKSIMGKENKTD
ncbi:MarR family winged helix-turn-helix transcriptional regulator [Dendrosporobacter sp. 1207_IL3150]|uniref:MarR family winged helix-turn-helix transcriptional regulator n=1 Tax=Dendrosporobacter sp. 1207_IL3150 TaxID=3084054 RepID=UPI002FDAB69B